MSSSVYEVVDVQSREVVYVGKANDVYERWHNHISHATNPLVLAMVANGVERYAVRTVETFATVREALNLEQSMIEEGGEALLNRQRPKKHVTRTPRIARVWNGRLGRCATYNVWFGKWKTSSGAWRLKRVPATLQDREEAMVWFADWLSKQVDTTAILK